MWGGFDNANVIANRQKDTYVHGHLDISGVLNSQCISTMMDFPNENQLITENNVYNYDISNNIQLTGSNSGSLITVPNVVIDSVYAGNSCLITYSNDVLLGNFTIPKYANVSITTQIPIGFAVTANLLTTTIEFGNATYSNTVLHSRLNSNIGNITLLKTIDFLKKDCDYLNSRLIIPLGVTVTGNINLGKPTSVGQVYATQTGNIYSQAVNVFASSGYIYTSYTFNGAGTMDSSVAKSLTVANITVPPYYNGNSISVYTPISANIVIASTSNLGNIANLFNNSTACNVFFAQYSGINLYANIFNGTSYFANIAINSTQINANIIFKNFNPNGNIITANSSPTIAIGTSTTSYTTLRAKQYFTTANITFTPIYTSTTNNYTIKMYSTGNIFIGPNVALGAAGGAGLLFSAGIEFNSNIVGTTYNGYDISNGYNLTLTKGLLNHSIVSTTTTLNPNITVWSNVNYSNNLNYRFDSANLTTINSNIVLFGPYLANTVYINSYNNLKPNITIPMTTHSVVLTNSSNTIVSTFRNGIDLTRNYLEKILVPNLDINSPQITSGDYTANIIIGNITIIPNIKVFSNITRTDIYHLKLIGNVLLDIDNFPGTSANTISNITYYANPPFNTTNGNSFFANSVQTSLNDINALASNYNYTPVSGNLTVSNIYINITSNIGNISIKDELNNLVANISPSNYYVNGTVGTSLSNGKISSIYYSNINNTTTPGTSTIIKDFLGNVSFSYDVPIIGYKNKTYSAYLSIYSNIEVPHSANIISSRTYSNITTNSIPSYISDNNAITAPTTKSTTITLRAPALTGNVYVNKLTAASTITAASFNATSDYRIKSNVVSIYDTSFTVDLLNPVTYYNKIINKQDIGFIAHEIQEQIPFLVSGEKDANEYQSLNYIGIIGILTSEIKNIKKENKILKEELVAAKEQINDILSRLEKAGL